MIRLYSNQDKSRYFNYLNRMRLFIILSIIIISIILITLFFLANNDNYHYFYFINSLLSIIFIWTLLLIVNLKVLPIKRKLTLIKKLEVSKSQVLDGFIKEISETSITINRLSYKTVDIELSENNIKVTKRVYIDVEKFNDINQCNVRLDVRNNIIYGYEVLGDKYD